MKEPTEEEILNQAEKLNDGELPLDSDQDNEAKSQHKVLAALQRINQISNNIKSHASLSSHQMKQGDRWAHLTIKEKIGQGGIGEVYCAYDPILDSLVAVKFLSKKSQLYISEKQFLQEARYMAKVRHPHVLAIHGATVDQHIAGYWSDYLNGDLLDERLKKHALSWPEKLQYAQQLTQAVKAIHNNQMVHGDIKPLNVMLQPERGAILLDFGSTHQGHSQPSESYIQQASPMAMAPEQFDGQPPGQASDVFSLGLILWQMSSNHHPLADLAYHDIRQQIKQLHSKQNQIQGPKAWRQLILSMTKLNAQSRPSIIEVERLIRQIKTSPIRKAKRLAIVSLLILAASVTLISSYSNYKTTQAQTETEAMNTLLSDILMTSSPLEKGKDVLLVDVLTDAQKALTTNTVISADQRNKSLLQLLQTYRTHGKHQQAIDLAEMMLATYSLTDSQRLDLLMQNADILNRTRRFAESAPLYLKALSINPVNHDDADTLVLVHIGLIKNFIETKQIEKIPAQIEAAKDSWNQSSKNLANLALLQQIEGNYYESMKQYDNAFEYYQKAEQNFVTHYGKENLNVLIAKGNAATVLSFTASTREKSAAMMEDLIADMMSFLGPEHPSTLVARANLASIYGQLNQPKKGLNTMLPHMVHVYKAFGPEGGTTMAFENIVAEVYVVAGEHQKANELFNKIISIHTKNQGAGASPTLHARLMRVTFLQEINELDQAEEALTDMYQIALESLPPDDRQTLEIQEFMIWNQYLQGNENAISNMQLLKDKKSNLFGTNDPATISTSERLEDMQ